MTIQEFYSHGKLLLTGEYLVLDGARALALPCKLGQSLKVEKSVKDKYSWTSYLNDGALWQKVNFSLRDILQQKFQTDFEKRLFQILNIVYQLNPSAFNTTLNFSTHLEFEKDWGLGSSSTLIYNIAQWANINPYELLDNTFGGSGYDVAAAAKQSPFMYRRHGNKVYTEVVSLSNKITPHLYFIYLNQKQNSREAIANYHKLSLTARTQQIKNVDSITFNIAKSKNLQTFEELVESHEELISELLKIKTIKSLKFKNYRTGVIKSLGAWGGDFMMVTAREKSDLEYFRQKGYRVIFAYDDLVF
jgi:mevalonate kinase